MPSPTPHPPKETPRKAVNITLEDELYWQGRTRAAQLRYPNISALLETLLAQEIKRPTIQPLKRKAA